MKLVIANLSMRYRRDFRGLRDFSIEFNPGILGLLARFAGLCSDWQKP